MSDTPAELNATDQETALLASLEGKPWTKRYAAYVGLSGPGWLQSALTLGGGSLASGLYLGVLAGYNMMWLQPLAMILGIAMLSAIGYVTLVSGRRPFRALNENVSPLLGWGWLIASMMANIVWSLPQYSLAHGVIVKNLLPGVFGAGGALGENTGMFVIVLCIMALAIVVTFSYGSGHWGVRLYELILKVVVGLIVLCFFGVVIKMSMAMENFSWSTIMAGFIPDLSAMVKPAASFQALIDQVPEARQALWSKYIVDQQRDVMMGAFATAVGINMTFLLPYSMISRGWGKHHRELAVFDLSTGMFIPFLLATSCVVISAAAQFHAVPQPGLIPGVELKEGETAPSKGQIAGYAGTLDSIASKELVAAGTKAPSEEQVAAAVEGMTDADRNLSAMLVKRDVDSLSKTLEPLFGAFFAKIIFGLGVLGMALSTITLLMLVSGFCFCELLDVPPTGTPLRVGSLFACAGALGPFYWKDAAAWLAVPTSVFGLVLLPIAYVAFLLMINNKRLMGEYLAKGTQRLAVNALLIFATAVALCASLWAVHAKLASFGVLIQYGTIGLVVLFFAYAILSGLAKAGKETPAE